MQLEKLQLDLRPRPSGQALDLGFALLRAHAGSTYAAWLALWLPLVAFCAALAYWLPGKFLLFLLFAWWLRAMLERAPLYVLSRRVFGEEVTWRGALKAWPSQLRGGWFSMLTWRRPFSPMRSLYAPVWQLEGARGKVAAERRRVIGRNGTVGSAVWFGISCCLFEVILAAGLLAFLGIFFGAEDKINPFVLLSNIFGDFFNGRVENHTNIALIFLSFAFSGAIIGPIFTACGFTLYLNRRATLEAWDLEIALRQIHAPQLAAFEGGKASAVTGVAAVLLCAACALFMPERQARAAEAAPAGKCEVPQMITRRDATREPDLNAQQTAIRKEVAALYDTDELRGYVCSEKWVWKNREDKKAPKNVPLGKLPDLSWLASSVQVIVITLALGLVLWLLYRFRDSLPGFGMRMAPRRATEIAGLDIRPESLPDDVPRQVMALWQQGEKRQALALLYRATISRLVHDNGLQLNVGATEGDCSRLAERAFREHALSSGRLKASATATELWLRAAYANTWPESAAVESGCRLWGMEFAASSERGQA